MCINILVVDDEQPIADLVEVYLKNDNYNVYKFYTGKEALACLPQVTFDLAILDVMLPDIDGFKICQKIREKYYFPIIMLTAKVEDIDKIMGLTLGADDYITKPFNPLALTARVKTQLRRYKKYNHSDDLKEAEACTNAFDFMGLIINKDSHNAINYSFEDSPIVISTKMNTKGVTLYDSRTKNKPYLFSRLKDPTPFVWLILYCRM